jgi:DNA processing protein
MQPEELQAWLQLLQHLSRGACRRLLARHGSPQAALAAGPAGWQGLLRPEQIQALRQPRIDAGALARRTLDWLQAAPWRSLLTLGDADYPSPLLNSADPPLLLYLEGRRELLTSRCIAVVGSRRPSAQGRDNAYQFAQGLGRAGFCVVSGLALGIDGAAHEGALETAGGSIAVLGCGLDQVYPPQHRELARRLASQGLLLSEYALGAPPLAEHFPQRNRIIAGLSEGCLVVEAAPKSGSLITARLAAEAGREVFAIPGSIHSPLARGCHELLKQGAALVGSLQDLLDELQAPPGPVPQASAPPPVEPPESPLLQALGHDPISLEQLMQRCGWPADQLNAALLELELEGLVARLPGALFQRRVRA